MELATALRLTLVLPIDIDAALIGERDGNDRTLAAGLRFEAVYHVGNLLRHAVTVVALVAAPFWQEEFVVFGLRIVPSVVTRTSRQSGRPGGTRQTSDGETGMKKSVH